ncbi:hypothetical protein BD410DRAFT_840772 [Rickenella mellea]|uniref:Uncharacterized protein n=1 Tax=Rickenella mellea TaxID=50990 RepID=A0A4Y7Q2N7_9AGAM|nr:hypothetical protein BD410DRAFT_840772 [Rickenella mellea]
MKIDVKVFPYGGIDEKTARTRLHACGSLGRPPRTAVKEPLEQAFSWANVISVSAHGDNGCRFLETPNYRVNRHDLHSRSPDLLIHMSSYGYDYDENIYDFARLFREDDNGSGNGGRKRGLLERLKTWTGAYSDSVEQIVADEYGVRAGEREDT